MEKTEKKEKRYGLVGKNIAYSFSKGYFEEKFEKLGLSDHSYSNFDLPQISDFKDLIQNHKLAGLNVTIPYKEAVIPFLNGLSETAQRIGAVNTIEFSKEGLIGHNTDAHGFENSLRPLLKKYHSNALILGTGGASKAVAYVLDKLNITSQYVSRTKSDQTHTYEELNAQIIKNHKIIVNCTPLGTHPNTSKSPAIPYAHLTKKHLLYDLIYNPAKTAFLMEGEKKKATIKNGLEMLQLQAEKAWEIWSA